LAKRKEKASMFSCCWEKIMNFEAVLWLSRIRQSNIIELLKKKQQHAHIVLVIKNIQTNHRAKDGEFKLG
jgi:hypothetical protein